MPHSHPAAVAKQVLSAILHYDALFCESVSLPGGPLHLLFCCRTQVLSAEAPSYITRHKQLVAAVLQAAGTLGLSDQVCLLGGLPAHSTHAAAGLCGCGSDERCHLCVC